MTLNEMFFAISSLKTLLEADGRDCDCINVMFNNKHIEKIDLEDDGTQQNNLDVILKGK